MNFSELPKEDFPSSQVLIEKFSLDVTHNRKKVDYLFKILSAVVSLNPIVYVGLLNYHCYECIMILGQWECLSACQHSCSVYVLLRRGMRGLVCVTM